MWWSWIRQVQTGKRKASPSAELRSERCGWLDLADRFTDLDDERHQLRLVENWARQWTVAWRESGGEVTRPAQGLSAMPRLGCEPMRGFSWRRGQRHRPGLQYLVSTGRLHGYESLEEARLLLMLDFAGDLVDVLSQPLRLRYQTRDRWRAHTPDFLAYTRAGRWLIDVRPASRVHGEDRVAFAAAAEDPTRCRATFPDRRPPYCDAALHNSPPIAAPPELLALQQRILASLHLGTDAPEDDHRGAAVALHDLRVLATLVRASWPAAQHTAPPVVARGRLAGGIEQLEQQSSSGRTDAVVHAGLPVDSTACAELLALAEHLATLAETPSELRELLVIAERRPAWSRFLRTAAPACSPRLREEFAPRLALHFPPRTSRAGIPREPVRQRSPHHSGSARDKRAFDYRHLPHILDEDITRPLFDLIGSGLVPRLLNRFAVTQLAVMTENCSTAHAGWLLDLPTSAGNHATARVRGWAHRHGHPDDLHAVLVKIADRMPTGPDLVDYRRRRDALKRWTLPEAQWDDMISQQYEENIEHGPKLIDVGDHGRLVASIIIWTMTTRGYHIAAPLLRREMSLRPQDLAIATSKAISVVKYRRASARQTRLHATLAAYSRELACSIDT